MNKHDTGWKWDAPLSKRTVFINVDAWVDAIVFIVCLFGFYALARN